MIRHVLFIAALFLPVFAGCGNEGVDNPTISYTYEFLTNDSVGKQPAGIYYDDVAGLFHVFCLGTDLNYNDIKDVEDENPSWWVIDKNDPQTAIMKMEFEWGKIGFPFRPWFDVEERSLYIIQNGKLKQYNIDDFTFVKDLSYFENGSVSKFNDLFFICINPIRDKPGRVAVYNSEKNELTHSIEAGVEVTQTLPYTNGGKDMLAILSQGIFGNTEAKIQFAEIKNDSLYVVKSFDNVGNTANHIAIYQNKAAICMNGGHEISLINLDNISFTAQISTNTSEFNGPREAVFDGLNNLYVSSYNGDIRLINLSSKKVEKIYETDGLAEGLSLLSGEFLLVANINDENYAPNNLISVFKAK